MGGFINVVGIFIFRQEEGLDYVFNVNFVVFF